MPHDESAAQPVIAAWRTTHGATAYLVAHLPPAIWGSAVPGVPRTTVRRLAAHLHNVRCRWIKSLGASHGVAVPRLVDLQRVRQADLLKALERSSGGIIALIELAASRGGRLPRATWMNFPTDLQHFLAYFAAHEAHHRGQLVLVARQLGHRLPREVATGVWQWNTLAREGAGRRTKRGIRRS